MTIRKFGAICGICVMLVLSLTFFSGDAMAQNDTAGKKNTDKKLLQKEGVSGALADGSGEVSKLPSRFQMGLGFGSCVAAFIAWKFL